MDTTDAIWVPSYYRRQRRISWLRDVGPPRVADLVAGAVFAGVVLALLMARTAPHEGIPAAAAVVTTTVTESDLNANRVVHVTESSTARN